MKQKLIAFILLISIISSFTIIQKSQTITGTWKLVCFSVINTGIHDCKPENDQTPFIKMEFKDNGKNGKITGNTISNNVRGNYKLSENNKISVDGLIGTKKGEDGWGVSFWNTIRQSSSYEYSPDGDTLIILYDNDQKAMKFLKIEY